MKMLTEMVDEGKGLVAYHQQQIVERQRTLLKYQDDISNLETKAVADESKHQEHVRTLQGDVDRTNRMLLEARQRAYTLSETIDKLTNFDLRYACIERDDACRALDGAIDAAKQLEGYATGTRERAADWRRRATTRWQLEREPLVSEALAPNSVATQQHPKAPKASSRCC